MNGELVALSLADLESHDVTAPAGNRAERRFLCPLPACRDHQKPKEHRSLSLSMETGAFHCHRCGARGLLREKWENQPSAAASQAGAAAHRRRYLAAREEARRALVASPIDATSSSSAAPAAPSPAAPVALNADMQRLRAAVAGKLCSIFDTPAARYLDGRGLAADFCHQQGIRFAPDFMGRPAVVFPIRDGDGALVATQGRYIDGRDNPRMRSVGAKSQGVFATIGALDTAATIGDGVPAPIVLTEAPIDALSLAAAGLPAAALCGCGDIPTWLKETAAWRVVVAAFDADDAGDRAASNLTAALSLYGVSIIRLRPDGAKDWNALLTERGVETLRSLIEGLVGKIATITATRQIPDAESTQECLAEYGAAAFVAAPEPALAEQKETGFDGLPATEFVGLPDLGPEAIGIIAELRAGLEAALVAACIAAALVDSLPIVPVQIRPGSKSNNPNFTARIYHGSVSRSIEWLELCGADSTKQQQRPHVVATGRCALIDLQTLATWYADISAGDQGSAAEPVSAESPIDVTSGSATPAAPSPAAPAAEEADRSAEPINLISAAAAAPSSGYGLKHWLTAWIHTETGQGVDDGGAAIDLGQRPSLASILRFALQSDTRKIYLCGPVPGDGTQGSFQAWALAPDVTAEWSDTIRGKRSYYGDVQGAASQADDFPVIRKSHQEERHECHIYRAAAWFGDRECTAAEARRAMLAVADLLGKHFQNGRSLELFATPSRTGLELWKKTAKGGGVEYPTLPEDVQHLIKSTSGQGRIELCTLPEVTEIQNFTYLDARFAYAASLGNLPAGEAVRDDRPDFEPYTRGRYRLRYTVPANWQHVGVFMTPCADERSWQYPAAPGFVGETWAGWTEVSLALRYGWKVEVLERLLFPGAAGRAGDTKGPLDTWGARLTAAYQEADAIDGDGALVKAALRSLLLFAIGGFARAARPRRVIVPKAEVKTLPTDNPTIKRLPSGDFEYWEREELPASVRGYQHPEWSAEIWARTRTRMLSYQQKKGRGEVVAEWGALHVPRAALLAIRTDALYLSTNPGFPDDGKPGSLRLKGQIGNWQGKASFPAPKTFNALNDLRDRSEREKL